MIQFVCYKYGHLGHSVVFVLDPLILHCIYVLYYVLMSLSLEDPDPFRKEEIIKVLF